MAKVFIVVAPHKLSATIEVVDDREKVSVTGRFGTDKAGYAAMRKHVAAYPERTRAVEGSNGAGRPLAQRLLADGEHVVDVPAKLSARARLFDTGHNRKTDARDAHAVAVVAVRTRELRVLASDVQLEALRLLVDRRAELTRSRIQCVNRVHRLLSELVPGQSKKDITTGQAKAILATVKPRDVAGKTRRRLAAEQIAELIAIEKNIKSLTKELKEMVVASGSTLLDRHRTHRRLLRRKRPPPTLQGGQPADEPHDPHRRRHPDPPGHPWPGPTTDARSQLASPVAKRCAA